MCMYVAFRMKYQEYTRKKTCGLVRCEPLKKFKFPDIAVFLFKSPPQQIIPRWFTVQTADDERASRTTAPEHCDPDKTRIIWSPNKLFESAHRLEARNLLRAGWGRDLVHFRNSRFFPSSLRIASQTYQTQQVLKKWLAHTWNYVYMHTYNSVRNLINPIKPISTIVRTILFVSTQ